MAMLTVAMLDLLQLYLLWHLGVALEDHPRLQNHIPLDRQLVALNHRRRAWRVSE